MVWVWILFWLAAGKMVKVDPFRVTVAGKESFGCVNIADFLTALRPKLKPNPTASRTPPAALLWTWLFAWHKLWRAHKHKHNLQM